MQVVAAELNNAGSREIVMFIIRVADDSGEWSVARRFRNFETLHRAMRGCGGGRDTCIARAAASKCLGYSMLSHSPCMPVSIGVSAITHTA